MKPIHSEYMQLCAKLLFETHTAWLNLVLLEGWYQPILLDETQWVQLLAQPNLTSMSEDRFAESGFSSQHRLNNMLADGARVQRWEGEEKMEWFRRGRGVTYLRLQGWGPSLPFFSQDSRVYFQIHCHGCTSPPGGPPLTNQLPAHLPAGQRPSVAHRWSLPLPAHRGQDQSREIYPALYQDRFTGEASVPSLVRGDPEVTFWVASQFLTTGCHLKALKDARSSH